MESAPAQHKKQENIYDPERDGRMEAEGDLSVLSAIHEQAQAVREGKENPNIRALLLILPGLMRGAYGGGQGTALQEAGLIDGFEDIVGISTGAPGAAYILSGNPREGASIYSEECTKRDFIRFKRILDGWALDAHLLSEIYSGEISNKALNLENIKNAHPNFDVVITEYESGKGLFKDAKHGQTIDLLELSCTVPFLYRDQPVMEGTYHVDGGIAMPFPAREVIERYNPTHILVLTNSPKEYAAPLSLRMLERVSAWALPKPLRDAFISRHERFNEGLEFLRKSGIPHLMIWNDRAVGGFTRNSEVLKAAINRGEQYMRALIDSAILKTLTTIKK